MARHAIQLIPGLCLITLGLSWTAESWANDSSIAFVGGVPHIQEEPEVALVSEHLRFRLFPGESMELPDGITCETYGQEVPVPPSDQSDTRSWFCATRHYRDGERSSEPEWYLSKGRLLLADLTYTFQHQGGETKTLAVGLPFRMPVPDRFDRDISGPTIEDEIEGFVTLLDGEVATVRRVDLDDTQTAAQGDVRFNRLYLAEVSFEPGQQRTLVHRYQSAQTHSSAGGGQGFSYLLRTGVGWAGPIGRVDIDFVLPGVGPCLLSSLPHTREGDSIRVALTEWEPDADFDVSWETNEFLTSMSGFYAEDPSGCDAMLSEDPERVRDWLVNTELAYGAPHDGDRAEVAAEGAAHFCQGADFFASLGDAAEMGDEEAQAQSASLRFVPESEFPANIPQPLRSCLQRARAQLSQ